MTRCRRLAWMTTCAAIAALLHATAGADVVSLEDLIEHTPLERTHLAAVRAGKVVTTRILEAGKRELSMALACLVRHPTEDPLVPFLTDRPILPAEHFVESGQIRTDTGWAGFDESTLELRDAQELAAYLKAHPGFELNLSEVELANFKDIQSGDAADRSDAVRQAIRGMLESRYRKYHEQGLDGISEYVRGGNDSVAPGELLARSLANAIGVARFHPSFEQAWLHYPDTSPSASPSTKFVPRDNTFFWASVRVDDRPSWVLAHRYAGDQILGQRTFYVSHFFEAGTTVVGLVAVPEGRVFFYTNRLWLDNLSGLGGAIKKKLGRRLLAAEMRDTIDRADVCRTRP